MFVLSQISGPWQTDPVLDGCSPLLVCTLALEVLRLRASKSFRAFIRWIQCRNRQETWGVKEGHQATEFSGLIFAVVLQILLLSPNLVILNLPLLVEKIFPLLELKKRLKAHWMIWKYIAAKLETGLFFVAHEKMTCWRYTVFKGQQIKIKKC